MSGCTDHYLGESFAHLVGYRARYPLGLIRWLRRLAKKNCLSLLPSKIPPTFPMSVIPSPNPFIHDPLPREDESPQEKSLREQEEARAKAVSDAIDEQIKQDKVAFKRYQRAIKILLLGQSESG